MGHTSRGKGDGLYWLFTLDLCTAVLCGPLSTTLHLPAAQHTPQLGGTQWSMQGAPSHLLHFHCFCAGVWYPWLFPGATVAMRFLGKHLHEIIEL